VAPRVARQEGEWSGTRGTNGGSDLRSEEWTKNPQYELMLPAPAVVDLVLWQRGAQRYSPIGFDIFESANPSQRVGPAAKRVLMSSLVAARQVTLDDAGTEQLLEAGRYVVVPCMHTADTEAAFMLDLHAQCKEANLPMFNSL